MALALPGLRGHQDLLGPISIEPGAFPSWNRSLMHFKYEMKGISQIDSQLALSR